MMQVTQETDELAKARLLIETLMRQAIAIEKHTKEMMKCLRESTVAIERQASAMSNVLRREMDWHQED